jgi:hypothetical protein
MFSVKAWCTIMESIRVGSALDLKIFDKALNLDNICIKNDVKQKGH